jgi:hypothetical protein
VTDSSYSFLFGPLVAAGALLVIMLLCRWVFSTSHRDDRTARRLARAQARGDYGLLVPITRTRTADDAQMLREVLRDAGIRCTVAAAGDGPEDGTDVLVFRADAVRARELVRS